MKIYVAAKSLQSYSEDRLIKHFLKLKHDIKITFFTAILLSQVDVIKQVLGLNYLDSILMSRLLIWHNKLSMSKQNNP